MLRNKYTKYIVILILSILCISGIAKILYMNIFSFAYYFLIIISILSLSVGCFTMLKMKKLELIINSKVAVDTNNNKSADHKKMKSKNIENIQKQLDTFIASINSTLTIISILVLVVSITIPVLTYAFTNEEVISTLGSQVAQKIEEVNKATDIQNQTLRAQLTEQYDDKINIYGALVKKYPNDPSIYVSRGDMWYDAKNYHNAELDYKKAVELGKKDLIILNRLGLTNYELNDYKEAINYFNSAINIARQTNEPVDYIYYNLGSVYDKIRNGSNLASEAISCFSKAIELNPSNKRAYYKRGKIYKSLGKNEDALEDLNYAISLDENYVYAYIGKGDVYSSMSRDEDALDNYNKAIELAPNNEWAYIKKASILDFQGNYEEAIDCLNQAISLNPENSSPYFRLHFLHKAVKDWDAAAVDLNKLIELDKNDINYYLRAIFYMRQNENSQALADINEAIRLNPGDNLYYEIRFSLLEDLQDFEKALEDLNILIKRDCKNDYWIQQRGYVLMRLGKKDSALKDLNKAIKLDPKNVDAYFHKGNILCDEEMFDQALENYNKCITIDKGFSSSIRHLKIMI